jgi:hypothetical protein
VPSDSFPPGEAKWCKPLACTLYYRWRVPFNERLSPVRFGRMLSAPTTTAALPVQCLLTLWKKFYAEFLLLSSAFFAIIEKILGKYTLAAFGECCGGYL